MARNRVRIGVFRYSAPRGAWRRAAVAVLGLVTSLASRGEAAGIARYLTAQDRSNAVFISETGLPISARSSTSSGSTPAYFAYPLSGGEHLPADIPTVTTTSEAVGNPVGPLDLTPIVQASLNADLDTARMAIVQTPTQGYAVEYLPRYGRSQERTAKAGSATGAGDPGQTTSSSSTASSTSNPLSALASNLSIAGIPASELSKWTSTGLNDLENALHLNGGKKATAKKPSTNVEAQYLNPPLAESSSTPLPTPAPEPSTWLVFGLLLGAAGWRHRAGKIG